MLPAVDLKEIPYFKSWLLRWSAEEELEVFLPTTVEFIDNLSLHSDDIKYICHQKKHSTAKQFLKNFPTGPLC